MLPPAMSAFRILAFSAALQTPQTPPDTLRAPAVMKNLSHVPHVVEVDLTAAPARLALYPGKVTDVWAYNGQVPGPTLDVNEGDSVIVHFTNDLPEATTIHWHGMHLAAEMDGSPIYAVPPGGRTDYVFKVGLDRAGTYWYHPHPDKRSGHQVEMGLYGGLIVHAAHDPLPPITEKLLILSDNRFNPDGSVDFPDPNSLAGQIDVENGREGPDLFINNQLDPVIPIRSGEIQRWRIVNASAARVYRLSIPGQSILWVGSDGGLFEHPEDVHDVLIANSERVEILVRGNGPPGAKASFVTLPYDRYDPHTRPADWDETHELARLAYSTLPPVTPAAIPDVVRPVPAIDTTQVAATKVVVFTQGLVNGRTMDMSRVDFRSRVGTTEIWEIDNLVAMDHPFHLHGFRFQILDRNGVPEPDRRWKDTVNVPKHQSVRIIVHFADFAGKWMFHCHILEHEDEGMMGILQTY